MRKFDAITFQKCYLRNIDDMFRSVNNSLEGTLHTHKMT